MFYLIIILAFSLFVFLPVKISVTFCKTGNREDATFSLEFLRVIKFNIVIPRVLVKIKRSSPVLIFEHFISNKEINVKTSPETIVLAPHSRRLKVFIYMMRSMYEEVNRFKTTIRFLSKYAEVFKLETYITFGIRDPAFTGIVAGEIWALTYFFLGLIGKTLNLRDADIDIKVNPIFDKAYPLEIEFKSIFCLRLGHIIIVSLIIVVSWIKLTRKINKLKGSDNLWKGIQLRV